MDADTTDADTTDAGGDYGMLQFLPFAVGAGIGALKQIEANRYWDDYYRNTGIRPRYPWRMGVYTGYETMAYTGSMMAGAGYRTYNYRRYGRY